MIKEFIVKMRDDNEQKINSLESEMNELVRDLSCAEQTLEKMIREKKSDTYIFSPRTIDMQIDEKIRAKQSEIRELNQKIEYVRHIMEERLKNRDEYNQLLAELEANNSTENCTKEAAQNQSDFVDAGQFSNIVEPYQTVPKISEQDSKSEYLSKSKAEVEKVKSDVIELNKNQLHTFLENIYKDSENCLVLVNGNKNRCKNEIRKLMKSISEFKKMIENDEV